MAIFEVLNNQQSYFNRYFRRNEGSTGYATIPEVTLSEGTIIELVWLAPSSILSNAEYILDSDSAGVNRAPFILQPSGIFDFAFGWCSSLELDGDIVSVSSEYPIDGKLHTIKITCGASAVGRGIGTLYARFNAALALSGILANLKIYDDGTLVRDYPINDNSSTIRDLANGQDGTIINGNDSDWGLFDRQADGDWLGQELVVNGGFDSDLSGWTVVSGGWSWIDSSARLEGDGSYQPLRQSSVFAIGQNYNISFTSSAVSGDSVLTESNASVISTVLDGFNSIGNYVATSTGIEFKRNAGVVSCSIDNVSVKEVLKNA